MNVEKKKLMIESALSYYSSCLEEAAYNDVEMLSKVIYDLGLSCTCCPAFNDCFNEDNKRNCIDTMSAWLRGDI